MRIFTTKGYLLCFLCACGGLFFLNIKDTKHSTSTENVNEALSA